MRANFFQDLEFFDRESISDEVYSKIGIYVNNPMFTPEETSHSSIAGAHICQWVRALYGCAELSKNSKPFMNKLAGTEQSLLEVLAIDSYI